MDTERRSPNGETRPSNDENYPPFAHEGKGTLSTAPSWLVPHIAVSSGDTPALGRGADGLGADGFRVSSSSDTEGRYVMSESQDHNLRGLTDRMDYADPRTDYDMHPHPGTSICVTLPSTVGTSEQDTRSGGIMWSSGQHANQAGSTQQSNLNTNSSGLVPDGLPHDPTTSGPSSHASDREDDSLRGARVRPRRRFMRWFRDHFNRQVPWSPFRRHDPSLVRQALREFDRIFHRR